MTNEGLEILLADRCKSLDLKQKAFDVLEKIFSDNDEGEFWNGFSKSEIKRIFHSHTYVIDRKYSASIIRTRIGLYINDEDNLWVEGHEPIGYYELDTDFNGEVIDDWMVIEKEKYITDIDIIGFFQTMNKKMPLQYLRRNHVQYEFVTYISFIGTLFMSKEFEGAGRFIQRACTYLEKTDNALLDKDYLRESKRFLKIMKDHLWENNLVSDDLKEDLTGK
jgi:hypothetical protein